MARQQLTYKCGSCGKTHTYKREDVEDNSLIANIWGDKRHTWPVWAICSDCWEKRNENNKMWPEMKGPKREVNCDSCEFEVELPDILFKSERDSFKCPDCGSRVR